MGYNTNYLFKIVGEAYRHKEELKKIGCKYDYIIYNAWAIICSYASKEMDQIEALEGVYVICMGVPKGTLYKPKQERRRWMPCAQEEIPEAYREMQELGEDIYS